ncbi:MAG: hypothetical protein K2F67_05755 [Eubacterium sp.]|nr:hypothetical protein [Eubacterium sp.]
MKSYFAGFFRKIIPLIICLSVILIPFSAYAVNIDLVDDEVYWIDRGDTVNYNSSDFQGFSKYIADTDEGCFYFFTRFTDYRIDSDSDENITLGFTVKNDINHYSFKVNKDGIINNQGQNSLEMIEVYYNFSEASCQKQGGGVFVAFKLKNKTDRTLCNSISCEYYCGLDVSYNLLDDVNLDMYVPETQKSTSNKATKATTQSGTKSNNTKSTTIKEKNTTESSTKFSGTGDKVNTTRSNSSVKFSGSATAANTEQTDTDNLMTMNEHVQMNSAESYHSINEKQSLSTSSKLLIAVFTVLFSFGLICIIIGSVKNKNAEKIKEECVESDEIQ